MIENIMLITVTLRVRVWIETVTLRVRVWIETSG